MLLILIFIDAGHPVSHNAALCLSNSSFASNVIQHQIYMRLVADCSGECLVLGASNAFLFTKADRVENRLHFLHERDHVLGNLIPYIFHPLLLLHCSLHITLTFVKRHKCALALVGSCGVLVTAMGRLLGMLR